MSRRLRAYLPEQMRLQERERMQSIMGDANAQGRTNLASHLAYQTDLSAEAAAGVLAAAAEDQPESTSTTGSTFEQLMNAETSPNLSCDHQDDDTDSTPADAAMAEGIAAFRSMHGMATGA